MSDDHLLNLTAAIAQLSYAVGNMGPDIRLSSITIDDGRGGVVLDAKIRSSPSFQLTAYYPDARKSPQVTRALMGVAIHAKS